MKRTLVALSIIAGAAAVAWWQPWAASETGLETAEAAPTVTTVTAAQAGMRVSIDPQTGEFTNETAPVDMKDLPASLQNALSTSTEGLVESPGVNGGVKLELQGRFQNTQVARIAADGTIEVPCLTNESELDALAAEADHSTAGEKE